MPFSQNVLSMKTYYAGKGRAIAQLLSFIMTSAAAGNSLYLGLLSILALGLGFLIGHGWLKLLYQPPGEHGNAIFRKAALSCAGISFLPFSVWMLAIEKNKPVPNFNQNLLLCCVISYVLISTATGLAHLYGKSLESNGSTRLPE